MTAPAVDRTAKSEDKGRRRTPYPAETRERATGSDHHLGEPTGRDVGARRCGRGWTACVPTLRS